jgi:hypothetical protein
MSLSLNGSGGIFGLDQGLNVVGVGTFQTLNVTGNLTVDGVLTYDDVTNIDSVGVITARSGIHVTGGNVGIGTDNPITKLNVHSGNTNLASQLVSDDAEVFLAFKDGDSTGNQQVQIGGIGNTFVAYAGGNERLRITSDGDVGINEISPDNKLHITTNSDTAYSDSTNNNSNLTNALLKLENTNGTDDSGVNNYVGIQFSVASGASSTAQLQYVRTGNNSGSFELKARNASSTMPNLVSIGSSGAVTLPAQERFKARKQTDQDGTDNASLWVTFAGSNGTVDYDTHSGFSESDDWYEIQNSGYFMIYATVLVTSTTANSLRDYQMAICEYDGTSNTILSAFTARASTTSDDDTHSMQATFLGNLVAGRKIRLRAYANTDGGGYTILDGVNDGVGGAGLDVNGTADHATQFTVVKLG